MKNKSFEKRMIKRFYCLSLLNHHSAKEGNVVNTYTNNIFNTNTMKVIVSLENKLSKEKYTNKAHMINCKLISYFNNWFSELNSVNHKYINCNLIAKETDSDELSWLKARIILGIHVILFQRNRCVCNPIFYCSSDKSDSIDRDILIGFFKEEVRILNQTNPVTISALWEYYVSMTDRLYKIL